MERSYQVAGMTCSGCAASVTRAITATGGGLVVVVDLEKAEVRVIGEHKVLDVKRAVEGAGFEYKGTE